MIFQLNGREIQTNNNSTVEQILLKEGYQLKLVAVEYNGNILPRIQYSNQIIEDNDVLEVVSFVGGG